MVRPTKLAQMVNTSEGAMVIRKSFTLFEKANGDVFWKAKALLPHEFVESSRLCANKGCCFATHAIGKKARRHEDSEFCAWCDSAIVEAREKSIQGHRLIATALSRWATHPEILLPAWNKLSPDFRSAAGRQATRQKERLAMAKHVMVHSLMEHRGAC